MTIAAGVDRPAPRDVWHSLAAADPNATIFQTPVWMDCVCASGRYADASRLYRGPSGRHLVLPMARRRHLPDTLADEASLPAGWSNGGLVGAAGNITSGDVAQVFADLADRAGMRVSVKPNPIAAATWKAAAPTTALTKPYTAHILDLDGGFERTWNDRFRSRTRTAVRRAERSPLTVEAGSTDRLLGAFYQLRSKSVARWARRQHEPLALARWRLQRRDPLQKFTTVAAQLGDRCRVWVAWLDDRPAAAIIVLRHGGNASYWRGAMDESLAGPHRANYLLHRLAIEEACTAGCRYYHMGDSGASAGLDQFKSAFGAGTYAYEQYVLERLPLGAASDMARRSAKRVLRFRDNA
jgi:Acetyltransferase (GNAT) domain